LVGLIDELGQVGEHYLAAGWNQELMTISKFLERCFTHSDAYASSRPYLAQHPLFEQVSFTLYQLCALV
jgi:lysine-specific demethylase 8